VLKAQDWRWWSVAAHLSGKDEKLVKVAPILERFGNFAALLGSPEDEAAFESLCQSETTGRPLDRATREIDGQGAKTAKARA
jgi:putative transposase